MKTERERTAWLNAKIKVIGYTIIDLITASAYGFAINWITPGSGWIMGSMFFILTFAVSIAIIIKELHHELKSWGPYDF